MKYPESIYAQNIVIGVMFHHTFAWYVTEREYWYLDYIKYKKAWLVAGYKDITLEDYSERFGITVLNENNAEYFLSYIEKLRVPSDALSEMMLIQRQIYEENDSIYSLEYYNDILDFIPCFFVNFDQKCFSSLSRDD